MDLFYVVRLATNITFVTVSVIIVQHKLPLTLRLPD